ncbi:hypothetical protein [Bradyrhizobium sp. Ai1a-2]|uniref:hypothetical protein n=1 Tax=Bradyrhizobium sp. Ai1a-2 TaxID=196490 RepID=UPI0003F57BAA|nr:hypothetical protein [Bradyrhizobium sp. Ai1a-2]
MNTHYQLQLLLDALRYFNDHITANNNLSAQGMASQIRIERMLADAVMFNAGWHAAKSNPVEDLKGRASTEKLLPLLLEASERARDFAQATSRVQELDAKLGAAKKPGRKRGSYQEWHYEPGYLVVVAMIETQPDKHVASHIRWAVKEGWLDEDTPDSRHERRIGLIRKRLAEEDAERLKALGSNVVKFTPRKRKKLH